MPKLSAIPAPAEVMPGVEHVAFSSTALPADWAISKLIASSSPHPEDAEATIWLENDAAGREALQTFRYEAAEAFLTADMPAQAVISARIAQAVSQGSSNLREALKDIDFIGRNGITGPETNAWGSAVSFFMERKDFQAAAVGALELGWAYGELGLPDNALSAFSTAANLLKHRLGIVLEQNQPARDREEIQVLLAHIIQARWAVLEVVSKQKTKVKGEARELLKAAVYDLDDLSAQHINAQLEVVIQGYRLLARSAPFWEKNFYYREAENIRDSMRSSAIKFLAGGANQGAFEPRPRANRRDLRPPVRVYTK